MVSNIIIHHLSGSKLDRAEQFSFDGVSELTIGRGPGTVIGYDPVKDIIVSRRHATIKVLGGAPPRFRIADLGSANGTFLNGQKLVHESELRPGDTVELGQGGPKFRFDVDHHSNQHAEEAGASRDGALTAMQMNVRLPPTVMPPSSESGRSNDRSMKIAGLIFAVLGTLSALSLAVYTYAVASLFVAMSGGSFGVVWQFLSVAIPIACMVGTGILWTVPGFGGGLLLGCAVVVMAVAGFNFLSMTTILLLGAGGGFALASAASTADAIRPYPQSR